MYLFQGVVHLEIINLDMQIDIYFNVISDS